MKKIVLIAVLFLVVGWALWYFLFQGLEKQEPLIAVDSAVIIKSLKLDVKDRELAVIWVLEKNGELRPVVIRKGITDDAYMEVKEIIWGRLSEGDMIVVSRIAQKGDGPSQAVGFELRQFTRGAIR